MQIPASINSILYASLYSAAMGLLRLKPWKVLTPGDVFGVQDPESGETAFISISGSSEKDFTLLAFKGFDALDKLWTWLNSGAAFLPGDLLCSCNAISITACSEDSLTRTDLNNAMAYTQNNIAGTGSVLLKFRTHSAGYSPQYLTLEDSCFLTHILKQTEDTAARIGSGRLSLEVKEGREDDYFMRIPVRDGDNILWKDAVRTVCLDSLLPGQLNTQDKNLLTRLKQLPVKQGFTLHLGILPVSNAGPEEARPVTFIFSASAQKNSGLFCAVQYTPGPDVFTLHPFIQPLPLQIMERLKVRPAEIIVNSSSLLDTFQEMADFLELPVTLDVLPPEMQTLQCGVLAELFSSGDSNVIWF